MGEYSKRNVSGYWLQVEVKQDRDTRVIYYFVIYNSDKDTASIFSELVFQSLIRGNVLP